MKKSQFICALMLSTFFATMARADDTSSLDNCARDAGESNCVEIGNSGTYYALSGDEGNQTMTIYGTKGSESNAAIVPDLAFLFYDGSWKSTVPEGVTSLKTSGNVNIGGDAFEIATNLTSVDLTGVQTIGDYAFAQATGLTGHLDLSGVQTIGDAAFENATGLTSVDLTGVQTIGEGAFNGATGLTSVDLTGVQTIGKKAFQDATGLKRIVISDSLLDADGNITGIDATAFYRSGLDTIYCPKDNACGYSFQGVAPDIIPYSIDENGQIKAGGKTYASLDDLASGNYIPKRIYTIDEANEVAGKVNSVKIRYR